MKDRCLSKDTMTPAIKTAGNYHDWVFSSLAKYIKKGAALEIGSGHGIYSKKILKYVDRLTITDIDPEAIETIRDDLSDCSGVDFLVMDGIEESRLSKKFDNIILLNVLEHVRDDERLVRQCHGALNKGGVLIIFAPAFPFLFSSLDEQAGHFRRYVKKELESLLRKSGFKPILFRYFNFIGMWSWLINGCLRSGIDSASTNLQVVVFNRMIWLVKCFEIFSFMGGQSVIVIGEKDPLVTEKK